MTTKEARKLLGKQAEEMTDEQLNQLLRFLTAVARERLGVKM